MGIEAKDDKNINLLKKTFFNFSSIGKHYLTVVGMFNVHLFLNRILQGT